MIFRARELHFRFCLHLILGQRRKTIRVLIDIFDVLFYLLSITGPLPVNMPLQVRTPACLIR